MKQLVKAAKNEEFKGKLQYFCQFPDSYAHQNHHTGQTADMSEPLDNRVVEYLKKQIRERCTTLNIIFFKARTVCPVKMMLHQTRSISDRTSDKTFFFKKNQEIKSLCGSQNNLELLYFDKYQT